MAKGPLFNPKYDTVVANEAINEGIAVTPLAAENRVEAVDATGELVFGFIDKENAVANQDAQIFREGGDAYGVSGAAIAKNAILGVNASGKLIPLTKAAANAVPADAVGYALEAVGAADNFVRFRFTRFTY